jgi:hypothetical protein
MCAGLCIDMYLSISFVTTNHFERAFDDSYNHPAESLQPLVTSDRTPKQSEGYYWEKGTIRKRLIDTVAIS